MFVSLLKDSETVALKLKNENLEKSLSDMKIKSTELAERYTDTQRELAKSVELQATAALEVLELKSSLASMAELHSSAISQKETFVAMLDSCKAANIASSMTYEQQISSLTTELEDLRLKSESKIRDIQKEMDAMMMKIGNQQVHEDALESYRKKAQSALLKVVSFLFYAKDIFLFFHISF